MATQGSAEASEAIQSVSPGLFLEPQDIATIIVDGKYFKVHKALLTQDSKYFERALDGPFVEGDTQTVEMGDDVTSNQFGIYVDTLYRSFSVQDFQYRPESRPDLCAFSQCLALWRLSDRFLNQRMQNIAQEALEWFTSVYSMNNWERWYKRPQISDRKLERMVVLLQHMFELCEKDNIPRQELFVVCASNMPVQLFTALYDKLDHEFRTLVMRKILMRYEKPGLKRPLPADTKGDEPGPSAKKQE